MSQASTNKLYRTFTKGLITEASPLTYPEDSSLDELNTVPSRKGNRTRRFGINYASDNIYTREAAYVTGNAQASFMWRAVGNIPTLAWLVVQNGSDIQFFDRSQAGFASSHKLLGFNLNDQLRPGVSALSQQPCHFASGKGFLFIVHPDIEPLIINYNPDTDTITGTKVAILARDLDGLPDGLANDAEPPTLSTAHFYNLLNQGWVAP